MTLAAPEHQEMNGQVEVTWRTLRTITHALMVHARVSEAYIHFSLMYTADHIFLVLTIKYMINEDGDSTTPFKVATGIKPSVSNLCVLFCPYVVRKAMEHVYKKALNMRHQAQKGCRGIFVGIPQHQKGYLVYVPSTKKIIYLFGFVSDESFSGALAYTSQTNSEVIAMHPEVTYIPYATYSKEQTGDIITLTQFEDSGLLYETRNDAESGDKSYENSIMPPILSKEEMDVMDSGDKSDDEPMSMEMLEDIRDGSQSHPNVNRI